MVAFGIGSRKKWAAGLLILRYLGCRLHRAPDLAIFGVQKKSALKGESSLRLRGIVLERKGNRT